MCRGDTTTAAGRGTAAVDWQALPDPGLDGVVRLGSLVGQPAATDGRSAVALQDQSWNPVTQGVLVTADGVVVVSGSVVADPVPLPSTLVSYAREWWTGSEIVRPAWSEVDGTCNGVGQVVVTAVDPVSGQRRTEPWPLPPPCLGSLQSVWTGKELLVISWADADTCSEVGQADRDCRILAAWGPSSGWAIRGFVTAVGSLTWAGDRLVAVPEGGGTLLQLGPDARVIDQAAITDFPPAYPLWAGTGLVYGTRDIFGATFVDIEGQDASVQPPPDGSPLLEVFPIGGDLVATSLGEDGQLSAWRGAVGSIFAYYARLELPDDSGLDGPVDIVPLSGEQAVPADRLRDAQGGEDLLVEGYLTAYDDEGLRMCADVSGVALDPPQCDDEALRVTGITIDDIPHTVRKGQRGQFTHAPILLRGSVSDGTLQVTAAPPKLLVQAEAEVKPAPLGRADVVIGGDLRDYPSLGQVEHLRIDVRCGTRRLDVIVGSGIVAQGEGGVPKTGQAVLYGPGPRECPADADCVQVDPGDLRLDTSAIVPGATYRFVIPLRGGEGTVEMVLTTQNANSLPRAF